MMWHEEDEEIDIDKIRAKVEIAGAIEKVKKGEV